jgi:hypothetical protein
MTRLWRLNPGRLAGLRFSNGLKSAGKSRPPAAATDGRVVGA